MRPGPARVIGMRRGGLGSRVGRDTLLNLAGQGLPLLVAVAAVPGLVARLGVERFGLLALAWTVLGSWNVVDLALGRAVTRAAAAVGDRGDRGDRSERGEEGRLPAVLGSALALQALLGSAGALLLAAGAPWLAGAVLDLPAPLAAEAAAAFRVLALSLPLTLLAGCLRSLLEGLRRFDLVNLVRLPSGVATFALPWLGAWAGWGLPAIVALLVLARAAGLLAHLGLCRRAVPGLRPRVRRAEVLALARFGGWLTVANLVPPLLIVADRFLIGALVSLRAVALYSVPFEVVFRLWILPTSVLAAVFPVLAAAAGRGDRAAVRRLAGRAARPVVLLLALPCAAALLAGRPLLGLWLGPDFAAAGAPVLALLAAGLLLSALASLQAAVLQALGRPDRIARLRLLELPLAAALSAALIHAWGIAGAALAALLRAGADALLLAALVRRETRRETRPEGAEPSLPAAPAQPEPT